MNEKRVEKIPIISENNQILGLVTRKDIERTENKVDANTDEDGKLYVGAAIGANKEYLDRTQKLIDAGVDVLVVDIANGHSTICIDAVKELKENFPDIDIVAGSIATGEGDSLLFYKCIFFFSILID
jgi:IMP dehydrogenase